MKKIEQAIVIAANAHQNQFRKLTTIPYITHPYHVGMLLLQAGCKEEVICAGLLHDTVEDTEITIEELKEEFGEEVAILVEGSSEPDKSLPWEERKQHTIDFLSTASKDICMVVCADKLSNLRSIRKELVDGKEKVWLKFNRGKNKQEWYYRGVFESISMQLKKEVMLEELRKEIEIVFGKEE